jgi:PKD repeat protein
MATYRLNDPRNISFIGKFKFDYVVQLVNKGQKGSKVWDDANYITGAFVQFQRGEEFNAQCIIANVQPDQPTNAGSSFFTHPYGGNGGFGGIVDPTTFKREIKFQFFIKSGQSVPLRGYFVLETPSPPTDADLRDMDDFGIATKYVRNVSGTVEGYVYENSPHNEFVDIQEYYPSENYFQISPVCPDNENEYWRDKPLDEKTVRQFPRYTTLNWFEMPDPTRKGTAGIVIRQSSGKGASNYRRDIVTNSALFTSYEYTKKLNAWSTAASNSGYIVIASNLSDDSYSKSISISSANCTTDTFSISSNSDYINYREAKIDLKTDASRKVTFNSEIYDWKNNHSDEITAYLVGFGSTGLTEIFDQGVGKIIYPVPSYSVVKTKSGVISDSQVFRYFDGYISLIGPGGESNSATLFFDNRQKWLFGMIDASLSKETFDDLESPPCHFDYPDYYVRSAVGCRNLNEYNQILTIDDEKLQGLTGSYSLIPIPIKGWKFNAMTLKQDKDFTIEGSGNVRNFTGTNAEPHYYGDTNLSGYRYLNIELRSKNNDLQNGNITIYETSKGPTTNQDNTNINLKSWKISTDSNNFKSLRIDLCNPDNKIDYVDNQDSPYPRLNVYTTSKPLSTAPFGYLSVENKPTDIFIETKQQLNVSSKFWIDDKLKSKISNSGFVYITDDKTKNIDYFEVNTKAFPGAGVGTNLIFVKPRTYNGKIKLAKPWNSNNAILPEYRKTLFLYIVKNDLTSGKSIDDLLGKNKQNEYPDEFEIYDMDPGYPDITDKLSVLTSDFVDGQTRIFVNPIPLFEQPTVIPYDAIILEDSVSKNKITYKFENYENNKNDGITFIDIKRNSSFDNNVKFKLGSTSVKLTFFNGTDDQKRTVVVKFKSVEKQGNLYKATLEYAKYDANSPQITDGIPLESPDGKKLYFSENAPVITVNPPRLVEFTFPVDSILQTSLVTNTPSGPEVNAIDDYPEDEVSNGPYYGVSRITKIEIDNDQLELGKINLTRNNSLSNFVISGLNNTFESQTKFDASSTTTTEYYTRRFWQQNTDGRDEEEGDLSWQHTKSENVDYWSAYPKTISSLCDDINKVDEYVAPRWLNVANPSSSVIRHPGWKANKITKAFSVDPITGERIYGNNLDPDYLNSDTGYAAWVFGGGVIAIPSGKNSGSGTSYIKAIDINFNDLRTILAQTVFHRINADFPPGKNDLFGNTSIINTDGTKEESTLHLRGALITRGPGYGLILPPQVSTTDNLREANLIDTTERNTNYGKGQSDSKGYFETGSAYGKNSHNNYIELEKSKNFTTPSDYRSSTRKMSQAKRERAAFKGGKQNVATNLSACESGFEKSIVIAYTVPTTKAGDENQTAIITTDSFFTSQYEKYPVGYNTITGSGVTIKGEFPFVLGSETHINHAYRVNTFLLTERNSNTKATSSHNYDSLIAANTDMRNKLSWFPFVEGQAKIDANFSTLAKAFTNTKYNSYTVSDQSPQLFNVGYADPGAIVFRSIPLNLANIKAPVTDKTIFIDGVAPTYTSDFRLLEPITSSGAACSSFPTVAQISSREYIVAYSLNATPRKINFKIIANYQVQDKNILIDLDALTGNTLSDKYNIYGLTSNYDENLGLHRSIFWCNGGIYYFEYALSSSNIGTKRTDKLHLVKGKLDDDLVKELSNRQNIITYYDSASVLNAEVPKQKPALITCQKQEYNGSVFVAYDTGKCYIEAVLFHPYSQILGTRKFDIECVNTSGSTSTTASPIADIQANPTSGQSALLVNFLSSNSYDPGGSTLTYAWNFGDGTQSSEENPVHTFVNTTANPITLTVSLVVTNASGVSSDPATITITVNPAPINNLSPQAKFNATPTAGTVPLIVTFTDQSTPANDGSVIQTYDWDFGDGNTALKLDNVSFTHEYTNAGTYVPTLIIKDNLGRVSSKFYGTPIKVDGTINNPPSPNFTWAQTSYSPTLKIQFTDTSVDVEGPLVAWHWDFGDTQTADVQNPEHIYANPGTYSVVLTVTDSGGLQASGTKQVTVSPPGNNPPIANFNYLQQNRKLVIDFADTSIDTDGTIVSWSWSFGDQTTSITKNPSHTYALAGTYQVILTVTDNGGKTGSITKNVVVNPLVNQPPVISNITGTQTSFKPLIGTFSETSSDPDGFITQWDWNFGDSQVFSTTNSALKNPTHTYNFPGSYTVTLTVTDDGLPDGTSKKTATSSIPFVVAPPPPNIPPVALFTVDTNNAFAPLTVNFTDNSTDADGKIVSWLWEFETGSTLFFNAQTYQKTVSHTFTKSGTYPVKLTVTDDGNLTNFYILNIVVRNNPPVSILSASPNPVLSLLPVSFFGNNSYDIDGNITKYSWDFGDGTTILQGTTAETHTYAKPGTYKASLTVIDNLGDSSTASLFINVSNRNPVAKITYTTLTVKAPGSLTFNGDTSTDLDGTIVSYNWTVSNGLTASTPNATFNFSTQGTFAVSLTVTDDSGGTNSTSVIVTVTPPDNILPVAILNVNKNSGVINDSFIFNVSNSNDPDGSIILYQLDFGDGTSTQFVNPAPISHIYKTVGSFTAKLTVTDNRNGVSLETTNSVQNITINNQPPIANFSFSPIGAFTFDLITFTDNSSDPENALSKWVWDYGDGTNFTTNDPLQKSPIKSYNKGNKDYTVSLTVYDNFNLSSTTSQLVHINNRKPFAVISTSSTPINNVITGIAPFTVIFDSNSYDLDGTVTNYEWYLNGLVGTPFTTKSFTYTFNTASFTPYVVTLRVQDDDGVWSDLANIGVQVNAPNTPPIAVIKANPLSNTSQAPITVNFSGAGSYDPDNINGTLIYAWDFGNGSISNQVNASTTYNNPGTYKVSLTVTDNLGATNTATLDYIVLNSKPIAILDTVPSGITQAQINTAVLFTSAGSNDPDSGQFINGYKWLVDGVNQNSNTSTLSTSFSTIGNHIVTLSVFDNLGLESNPVSKTIFVISAPPPPPVNQNPIAILGNEPSITGYIELKVGDTFTFDGTTSYDPEDGSNITFEWSIDGVKSGYTSTFVNQFNAIGIFTVSLVVFDTLKLASTPATNLGKRYTVNVNVSAAPNPLANKLFSSGQALNGAIASGSNSPDRYGFQLVDDTKQYTIIEAGLNHTFVVDAAGVLYAAGSNSNGQLGFSSNITQLNSLTAVPLASKYKVVKVSAGDLCSAIIADDTTLNKRVLLVCGSNINGIFGQALPRTNIYNFQPILERATTNNGASYLSNNSFLDVSCNSYILAFTDNRQVWVAGKHNYINKTGISDTGFFPINIDPNPDLLLGSINYLNPFRLEVGFNNQLGFVTGLSYDIDNQIVWFAGLSSLRGWGYAYDISTYENSIVVITASQDPFFDHAIYLYFFSYNEIPQFNVSAGLAADLNPGENFLKVSTGRFGYLALSETLFYPYGINDYGQLGYAQSITSSIALNNQYSLPGGVVLPNKSVTGISDIAAGGNHSIILASNVKPSSQSFTITKPGGYATDPQFPTSYPITQIAG